MPSSPPSRGARPGRPNRPRPVGNRIPARTRGERSRLAGDSCAVVALLILAVILAPPALLTAYFLH